MGSRWIALVALALGCATGNYEDDTDAGCVAVPCEETSIDTDASVTPDLPPVTEDLGSLDEPLEVLDAGSQDAQEDDVHADTTLPEDVFVARDDGPEDTGPLDSGVDRFAPADVCTRTVSVSGHAERDCSGGCEIIEEIRAEGSYLEVRSDDRRDRITLSGFTASGRVRSDSPIRSGRASGSQITLGGSSLSLSGATASGSFDFGPNELAAIDGAGATLRFTDTRGNVGVITLTGAGCP
jgi:hypothetical protein